jgi:hypothetical protein
MEPSDDTLQILPVLNFVLFPVYIEDAAISTLLSPHFLILTSACSHVLWSVSNEPLSYRAFQLPNFYWFPFITPLPLFSHFIIHIPDFPSALSIISFISLTMFKTVISVLFCYQDGPNRSQDS